MPLFSEDRQVKNMPFAA